MTVGTQTVFELSLLNIASCLAELERKKEYEKWHFHYPTLLCLAVFCEAFGQVHESC